MKGAYLLLVPQGRALFLFWYLKEGPLFSFGTAREGAYSRQGAYYFFWETTECSKKYLNVTEIIRLTELRTSGHNSWET